MLRKVVKTEINSPIDGRGRLRETKTFGMWSDLMEPLMSPHGIRLVFPYKGSGCFVGRSLRPLRGLSQLQMLLHHLASFKGLAVADSPVNSPVHLCGFQQVRGPPHGF